MYTREMILERKASLEQALQELSNEYQRLAGAIQLCDAMLAELDAQENAESKPNENQISS